MGREGTRMVRFDVYIDKRQVIGDVPVSTDAKKTSNNTADTSLNIQVNTSDGRLLQEFSLDVYDDDVRTLGAAKRIACKNRSYDHGKLVVFFVGEKTPADVR